MKDKINPTATNFLRQKAEEFLKNKATLEENQYSDADIIKLIQELDAYQIEIDLQNEELRVAMTKAKILDSILESQKDTLIFSIDRNYHYLSFNKAHAESMKLAYNAEIKMGMNILDCISSIEDKQAAKDNYDRAFTGESHSNIKVFGDVEKAHYESFFNPILDENHKIIGATGLARNITKRIQYENYLKIGQENLQAIFDSVAEAIYVLDETGAFIDVNKGAEEMYMYLRKELIGKSTKIVGATGLNDFDEIDKIYQSVFDTGVPITFEFWAVRSNGEIFPKEVVATKGKYLGKNVLIATARDITERKKNENSLQKSQEQLEGIFNLANSGIVLINNDGRFLTFNDWCCNSLGYTRNEFQELTTKEISHPDDLEESSSLNKKIIEGKIDNYQIEKRYIRKDKSILWCEVSASAIKNKANNVVSIIGIINDITERRKIQDALRDSEKKLRSIFDTANSGILSINKNGEFIFFNDWWVKILGYTREEIYKLTFIEVTHPDDVEQSKQFVQKIWNGEIDKCSFEKRYVRKDTTIFWGNICISAIVDHNNKVVSTTAIVIDITSQKQAEKALEDEKRRLDYILYGTGAGTWEWNMQTGVIIANERWAELIGYTIEELGLVTIDTWKKFTHPDDSKFTEEIIDKHSKGELDFYESYFRMRHKNGNWIWIHSRGNINEWDPNGNPLLMSGTHLDITERKLAEQKLIASEKLLTDTQFIANIGSYSLDLNNRTCKRSSALERICGIDSSYDITTEGLIKIIHPDWQTVMIDYFNNEIFTKKSSFNKEYKIIKRDTLEERWVHGTGEIIDTKDGQHPQLIGSIQDITDRKKMELALIDSENFAKATFDALSSNIAILDGNGVILSVNKAWIDFMESNATKGSKINSTIGQNYLAICENADCEHDADAQAMLAGIRSVMKREQKEFTHEYACHSPSELRWFNARVTNFPGDNDSRIVVAHEDITARKLATINQEKTLDLFQKITRRLPGLVYQFLLRPDGTSCFPYASDGIKEIYGVSPDEVKEDASKVFKMLHPDDLEGVMTAVQKSAETLTPWNHEFRAKYADGSIKYLTGNSAPEKLEDGSILWHGVVTDSSERHETSLALSESEEKYRGLVENSPYGILIYIGDTIAFINDEVVRMLKAKDSEEIIGKSVLEFVHPDNIESIIQRMKDVIKDNNPSDIIEEKFITVDGTPFDVEIRAIPTIYKHKHAVQVIAHDITQRKQSALELNKINRVYALTSQINNLILRSHNQHELFQEICNIAVDFGKFHMCWIGLLNADGTISVEAFSGNELGYFKNFNLTTNPNVPEGRGITGTALRENRTAICNDIANDPNMIPWREKALERNYSSSIAIPINIRNKTIGVFSLYSKETNFFSSEEEISLLEKIILNIAFALESILIEEDRKLTEEKIRKLSRAVEQSPVTILITNTNGTIEYVNPKFLETTGYSYEEVLGKNPRVLKSGYTSPSEYQELYNTVAAGHEWHGEFHNKRKDGSLFWEAATISPILNSEGIITHYIAVKEDITERKKVEEELIKSKERAEESDRLKLVFLANMSHEIRTPMNGILGFTELLKLPHLTGDEQQEYINIIEKSGKRMLNIINDIINISKIEAGQIEISLSKTDINEQLNYIETFFKPEAKQKRIKLHLTKILAPQYQFIKTDKEKIYAILTNLVKNAIKFTNEGTIEFGCEMKGENLECFVKDSGIGISDSQKSIVFERFRQANESISRSHEGSGLGLAISKAYIEMLDGKIWVESEKGKGSTFYFTIPFVSEAKEETAVQKVDLIEPENKIKDLKVLIVEDDAISKLLITIALKPFSKEILKVVNGFEAIKTCRDNPNIDLVMMDINMPEMGGYEATKLIREFNKDLIIIAQTANGMQSDREAAIAAGCTDYISKPINVKDLGGLIQKYFKN